MIGRFYAGCTVPQSTEAASRLLQHINIDLSSDSFHPDLDVVDVADVANLDILAEFTRRLHSRHHGL